MCQAPSGKHRLQSPQGSLFEGDGGVKYAHAGAQSSRPRQNAVLPLPLQPVSESRVTD